MYVLLTKQGNDDIVLRNDDSKEDTLVSLLQEALK